MHVVKYMKIIVCYKRTLSDCHRHRYATILIKMQMTISGIFSVNNTNFIYEFKQL